MYNSLLLRLSKSLAISNVNPPRYLCTAQKCSLFEHLHHNMENIKISEAQSWALVLKSILNLCLFY